MAAEKPAEEPARWIEDAPRWARLLEELAAAPAWALDTEFHRERTYFPRLALLQVAWPGGIALVDPLAVSIAPLARVLEGPGLVVVHAAEQDLEILERECGRGPQRLLDTQLAAGFLGMSSPSLQSLVETLLGKRLAKGDRLTDWTRRPLSEAQRLYAAADVAYLLDLERKLRQALSQRGRAGWAEEECERMRCKPRPQPVPEQAWWRMKDARRFKGPARGVAQEVAAWRERLAAERDVPARFVLADLALSAVAHRAPRTRSELEQLRGLEGRHIDGRLADDLLAAVERGRRLEGSGLVLMPAAPPLEKRLRPVVSLAAAWVSHRAEDLQIDAALLGTRSEIEALLRGDGSARMGEGWRRELVGEALLALADGGAALAVGQGGLVMEERSRRSIPSGRLNPGAGGPPGE